MFDQPPSVRGRQHLCRHIREFGTSRWRLSTNVTRNYRGAGGG
jgi:hypothetical protein